MQERKCYHCGARSREIIHKEEKVFCCLGCLSVYEIIKEKGLNKFYELNPAPGIIPDTKILYEFEFLDEEKVRSKLIDFQEGTNTLIRFFIPSIHCSSCIWLLENLPKLNNAIYQSIVNFNEKTLQILYKNDISTLSQIATFLAKLGYKPLISLESIEKKKKPSNDLLYKLAVCFFSFGNVMLLAFPEYIGAQGDPFLEEGKYFFRWAMFFLSLPVLLYSSTGYFLSAYRAIRYRVVNIDVPISIGILSLFIRSCYEIIFDKGPGYFDSFTGLVFFMLIGRYFQAKTYDFLAFDRDYKSFYPIAVIGIREGKEENLLLSELKKGDHILIRNEELIPVDSILIKGEASIDNSFISGESKIIKKKLGDKIYAGGKQKGKQIELKIIKDVEHSYLRQLWNNKAFRKNQASLETMANKWSRYFTPTILSLSFLTGLYWYLVDPSKMLHALCSVLLVACPCALSLSTPFTLGNLMRIMAKKGFYIKNINVIEQLAKINSIVFDKTGTLTQRDKVSLSFLGKDLSEKEKRMVLALVKNSRHVLSQSLYQHLRDQEKIRQDKSPNYVKNFKEIPGKGLEASIEDMEIKLGSASYIEIDSTINKSKASKVFLSINKQYKGCFLYSNTYRKGIESIFNKLSSYFTISLLSGDNDAEKPYLSTILPPYSTILFDQDPYQKRNFIEDLQKKGQKVMMIGDGLNDAGALKQSHVGIAISEDTNSFSPNCDILMLAKALDKLPYFIKLSKIAVKLVIGSFIISLLYNIIGLSFAIEAKLTPLIAAILMPLSTLTVIVFSSLSVLIASFYTKKIG